MLYLSGHPHQAFEAAAAPSRQAPWRAPSAVCRYHCLTAQAACDHQDTPVRQRPRSISEKVVQYQATQYHPLRYMPARRWKLLTRAALVDAARLQKPLSMYLPKRASQHVHLSTKSGLPQPAGARRHDGELEQWQTDKTLTPARGSGSS